MTVDPSTQILPAKEAALFKSIISFHEHRQYKKGLKVCEQVLKKCPYHAETVAMKGLFLGLLEKKEEGYEFARQAIKYNFKSHVCWHVFGLLYRNDKNYEEAQKCYKTALRFDPENGQILRDLAVLQIQTGHYEGLLETRLTILRMNPQVKTSWISLTISYHLLGKFDDAIKTLDQYLEHVSEATGVLRTTVLDAEMTELHLYKAMVLEEAGLYQTCLEYLTSLDVRGGDILKYRAFVARMLLKTGAFDQSLKAYKKLFSLVPENLEFLKGIETSSQIDFSDEAQVIHFIAQLKEEYPRSNLVKSNYLKHLKGDAFEAAFKDYALPLLKKGAPSVFNSVKHLYHQEHHLSSILSVVEGLLNTFKNLEDIKATFWCLYFLTQHYDYIGESKNALKKLDEAYALDQSVPDLFIMYGILLQNSSFPFEAVKCAEHARKMDLGDRFLNTISVKYMLRTGNLKRAKEILALFLKEGTLEKQMADLAEIQCIWFDLEAGKCLMSNDDCEGAKVYFERVTKLFDEFVDDQLDFHNYALRKMTLTYYVELLRYERTIYREENFRVAAESFIECCQLAAASKKERPIEEALESLKLDAGEDERIEYLLKLLEKFHPGSVKAHELAFNFYLKTSSLQKALNSVLSLEKLGADVCDKVVLLKQELETCKDNTTKASVSEILAKISLASKHAADHATSSCSRKHLSSDDLTSSIFLKSLE